MKSIDSLPFEIWYEYGPNRRKVAAFHFRFEAEKYLDSFHHNDSHYSIEETEN